VAGFVLLPEPVAVRALVLAGLVEGVPDGGDDEEEPGEEGEELVASDTETRSLFAAQEGVDCVLGLVIACSAR